MNNCDINETRDFWNRVAEDWRIQVGTDGDTNRILNSDPVLWAFAGNVAGLRVLDAGCGTGYLSKQLSDRGALVTGVDFSERMIAIARADYPDIDFRVDSCNELHTLQDAHFDMVVAKYVLMDNPDLPGAMHAAKAAPIRWHSSWRRNHEPNLLRQKLGKVDRGIRLEPSTPG